MPVTVDWSAPLEHLPSPLPIPPWPRGRAPFDVRVRPPGSKSLTNRALLLAALAEGGSTLRGALVDADDAQRMAAALRQLGATIDITGDVARVRGVGGRWRATAEQRLDLNNAGTATRFLAAAATLSPVPIVIDGNARMRQRPIGELIAALEPLGVRAEYLGANGFPPVRLIPPAELPHAATIEIPTTLSSQFISALALIAPWLPGGLTLRLVGEVTSASYVAMTVGLLDRLGVPIRTSEGLAVVRIAAAPLAGFTHDIEPDASGATYFWAAAAILAGARCQVEGLTPLSLQGDAEFPAMLERAGAQADRAAPGGISVRGSGTIEPVMADLAQMPDAAMTLASVLAFAKGRSVLRGLKTLRVKETDRIEAMRIELAKIGVKVEPGVMGDRGAITIDPPVGGVDCSSGVPHVEFDTYDDHRMAMSLSLIGLRRPNVWIRDPACVAKTYATYWRDLGRLLA